MCRSRRELSNEYLLANSGFDTVANGPFQVCTLSAYRSSRYLSDAGHEPIVLEARDVLGGKVDSIRNWARICFSMLRGYHLRQFSSCSLLNQIQSNGVTRNRWLFFFSQVKCHCVYSCISLSLFIDKGSIRRFGSFFAFEVRVPG